MKYDLDELLKDACNEEMTPSHALNQMTLQKIKDGNKSSPSVKYGIKRFAQWAVLCVSICLLVTVSVPAFTAVVTYIKEVTKKETDKVEIETTTEYRQTIFDNPEVKYMAECDVLIVYGEGDMELLMYEELEQYKNNVKEIIIKDGVTGISTRAFMDFKALESVEMADSVTHIDSDAFRNCSNLKEIKWSSNLEIISSHTFTKCTNLVEVHIPEGIKEIEGFAFLDCAKLESVTIPDSIEKISLDSFAGTKWMDNQREDENGYVMIGDDILLSGLNKKGDVVIPDGVKIIAEYAFYRTEIESVVIPDSVVEIGHCAFGKCSNLKEVYMGDSVGAIASGLFIECESLETIVLGKGITKIESKAFEACGSLENIIIPEGVEYIGDYAFNYCSGLEMIELPESLNEVGVGIFTKCDKLNEFYGKSNSYAEKLALYGDYKFAVK